MGRTFLRSATAALLIGSVSVAGGAQDRSTPVRTISAAEREQGAKAHQQLLSELGGPYTGPQSAYVEEVGQRIAIQSGLAQSSSEFEVTLLNSPVNNAFAIPGGYVYVTRQLVALMNNEAELAGVMGHEVGHVAARHSERRQQTAQRNSIIGLLGQIAAAAVLGDSEFGRIGQEIFGTGTQLLTLKYSRKQETEADDLGVAYLRGAGYDPLALSTMLASLAAQSSLDQRAAGSNAVVPTWASTHPDPARRVTRAARVAGQSGGRLDRDVFLTRIDGILYGDDPQQGMIDGLRFRHPTFRLQFTAPSGFSVVNGTSAVAVSGQSGKAQFSTRAFAGNLDTYVNAVFAGLAEQGQTLPVNQIRRTTINGIPVAFATARVTTNDQTVDATVYAYEFSRTQAFHFVTLSPAGRDPFGAMYQSVRRLSAEEVAAIRPRKLRVVTVARGDSVQSLAGRMAFDSLQLERFLTLNALRANATLAPGQKVKIVTY